MSDLDWRIITKDRLEVTDSLDNTYAVQRLDQTWAVYKNSLLKVYKSSRSEATQYVEALLAAKKDTTINTQLVVDFEVACVALSWMGAQPPETHNGIKARYREAREKLLKALAGE